MALLLPFVIAPPLFPSLSPPPCAGSPCRDPCGAPLLYCTGCWALPCFLKLAHPSDSGPAPGPRSVGQVGEDLFSFHDGRGRLRSLQLLRGIRFPGPPGTLAGRLETPPSLVALHRRPCLSWTHMILHFLAPVGRGYPELWLLLVLQCSLRTETVCPGALRQGRLSCDVVWTCLLSSAPSPGSDASGPDRLCSGTVQEQTGPL